MDPPFFTIYHPRAARFILQVKLAHGSPDVLGIACGGREAVRQVYPVEL